MKVYIDWRNHRALTEEEYKKSMQESATHTEDDVDEFYTWLNDNYEADEIWTIIDNEEAQAQIKIAWHDNCVEGALIEHESDFEEFEFND